MMGNFYLIIEKDGGNPVRVEVNSEIFASILSANRIEASWNGSCKIEDGILYPGVETRFVVSGLIGHETEVEMD